MESGGRGGGSRFIGVVSVFGVWGLGWGFNGGLWSWDPYGGAVWGARGSLRVIWGGVWGVGWRFNGGSWGPYGGGLFRVLGGH